MSIKVEEFATPKENSTLGLIRMKKFLADGMVGRLARWMRLVGCDVVYLSDVPDDNLIERATAEGRVLLTCDVALYRMAIARGAEAFLVKGKTEAEKLARVANKFDIKLEVNTLTSRCPTCGSKIEPVPKSLIRDKIPITTFKAYDEFWACTNAGCGKIYWQGSHWKKIDEILEKADRIKKRLR